MPAHGLGPMWFAIPSSQWTCTTYSLPVSRHTCVKTRLSRGRSKLFSQLPKGSVVSNRCNRSIFLFQCRSCEQRAGVSRSPVSWIFTIVASRRARRDRVFSVGGGIDAPFALEVVFNIAHFDKTNTDLAVEPPLPSKLVTALPDAPRPKAFDEITAPAFPRAGAISFLSLNGDHICTRDCEYLLEPTEVKISHQLSILPSLFILASSPVISTTRRRAASSFLLC
jgi:hypothetical protein